MPSKVKYGVLIISLAAIVGLIVRTATEADSKDLSVGVSDAKEIPVTHSSVVLPSQKNEIVEAKVSPAGKTYTLQEAVEELKKQIQSDIASL